MAEPVMLADARPTRFARPGDSAVELVGRSPAVTRVHELIRRAAGLDGGALITAETGVDVEAVARELHHRGRASTAPFIAVRCDAGDSASVDRELFGSPTPESATDLELVAADSCIAAARGGTLYLHS